MFRETLLESSPTSSKRKRWPMATAFTVEAIIAGVLITVPLLSTGVIPVSARVPLFTPFKPVPIESVERASTARVKPSDAQLPAQRAAVVTLVSNNKDSIYIGRHVDTTADP